MKPGWPAGDEIHPLARILAVVDCYDALRSSRPYRGPVEENEVRRHLQAQAGSQFEPRIIEVFLELLEDKDQNDHLDAPALSRGLRG